MIVVARSCCPWLAALSLLALLAGCGYRHGGSAAGVDEGYQWASLYRADVRSVAVPIFTNRTFARGVEFRLTEAIVKQMEARTPYKVAPRERADTILEGQVLAVQTDTVSPSAGTGLPQEQLQTLIVSFIWKDLRTGRILVQRRNFEQSATYYPTLGESGFTGSQQAVERLALGIVQELQADW